jgi:hypothetical protein
MGLFGVEVAASLLLILAYDRPFTGEFAVNPNPAIAGDAGARSQLEGSGLYPSIG